MAPDVPVSRFPSPILDRKKRGVGGGGVMGKIPCLVVLSLCSSFVYLNFGNLPPTHALRELRIRTCLFSFFFFWEVFSFQ